MRPVLSLFAALGAALLFAISPPSQAEAPPTTGTGLLLNGAIITPEHVQKSIDEERTLSENYKRLPKDSESWFALLEGCKKVLVTAPHATNPTREGELRFADTGTGSLAQVLHTLTGARTLYTTMASPSDPNYYDDNAFKSKIVELIADEKPTVLLDLHGSHPFRPYDVDFGTMQGQSLLGKTDLLETLSLALKSEGLSNQSKDFFPASKNMTVTKFASARGVPSIQLEISSTWLSPGSSNLEAHRYAQLLQGLTRYIKGMGCEQTPTPASPALPAGINP